MRILIVDDEPQIVECMKNILNFKGHSLDSAIDGKKWLELLKSNSYDLVFLDVSMPGVTGVELVRYMNENNIQAKKILFTGHDVLEGFGGSLSAVDGCLKKPFTLADVEYLLAKYDSSQHYAKGRILMINDEDEISGLVIERLQNDGFEVITARDGEKGVQSARQLRPDLILLGNFVKSVSGEEICKAIRDDKTNAKIPIIMLNVKESQADRIVGRVIGADCYLTKPLDSSKLLESIHLLLSKREIAK